MKDTNTFSPNNNPDDKFFSQMYFPMLQEDKGELFLSFKSGYNYDLEILFTFDAKSCLLKGGVVRHEIKGWEYPVEDARKIGGFENNSSRFMILMSISGFFVKTNLELIHEIMSKPKTGLCEGTKHFEFPTIDEQLKKGLIKGF